MGCFESEIEANEYYEKALKSYQNNEIIIIKKPKFSSNYKGVSFYKDRKKWVSYLTVNGKSKKLGYFDTEIEAHLAYEKEKPHSLSGV